MYVAQDEPFDPALVLVGRSISGMLISGLTGLGALWNCIGAQREET
jgi:hypothetical protein